MNWNIISLAGTCVSEKSGSSECIKSEPFAGNAFLAARALAAEIGFLALLVRRRYNIFFVASPKIKIWSLFKLMGIFVTCYIVLCQCASSSIFEF